MAGQFCFHYFLTGYSNMAVCLMKHLLVLYMQLFSLFFCQDQMGNLCHFLEVGHNGVVQCCLPNHILNDTHLKM